jgi:hypothetical protein
MHLDSPENELEKIFSKELKQFLKERDVQIIKSKHGLFFYNGGGVRDSEIFLPVKMFVEKYE